MYTCLNRSLLIIEDHCFVFILFIPNYDIYIVTNVDR